MKDDGRTRAQLTDELLQLRQQVTQLKISKGKIQQQVYQAQQRIESLGQSSGEVAHDLKNVLTVIRCYTELLLEYVPPDDPLHIHIKKIEQSVYQGSSLTQRFLEFGPKRGEPDGLVDLNALIADMEEMLDCLVGHNVKLITALRARKAFLKIDKKQMEQVIINLVVNAYDAMPHGGRLFIKTVDVEKDEHIMGEKTNGHQDWFVELVVRDTGLGMDRQTQARIFEPFFTTKTAGNGSGLGLAQVQKVATQCDGHIKVASQLRRGTTFTLCLPTLPPIPEPTPAMIPEPNIPEFSLLPIVPSSSLVQ
jgi:signal transduction histidine kinase